MNILLNKFASYYETYYIYSMKKETYNIRGTEMNKILFAEMESYLEDKNMDVNECFTLMADEKEYVYVSNGFVRGLIAKNNEPGEWHHFFKKNIEGSFTAGKLNF